MDTLAQIIARFDAIDAAHSELIDMSRIQRARVLVLLNSLIARVDLYQRAFGVHSSAELGGMIERKEE